MQQKTIFSMLLTGYSGTIKEKPETRLGKYCGKKKQHNQIQTHDFQSSNNKEIPKTINVFVCDSGKLYGNKQHRKLTWMLNVAQ